MFGSPATTTGGNALTFYASVRLDVRRIGALKDGETVVGAPTRVKVVKKGATRRSSCSPIKVVVSSRDHREHDEDIERRDFEVAVVVFEKLQAAAIVASAGVRSRSRYPKSA